MDMNEKNGRYKFIADDCIMPLTYYNYKLPFLGSGGGLRYRISRGQRELPLPEDAKEGEKPPVEKYFILETWPEPLAYDATDPAGISSSEYPFTEEGYEELLNEIDTRAGQCQKA